MKKRSIIILLLVLVVLVTTGCATTGGGKGGEDITIGREVFTYVSQCSVAFLYKLEVDPTDPALSVESTDQMVMYTFKDGDKGFVGIKKPENILEFSKVTILDREGIMVSGFELYEDKAGKPLLYLRSLGEFVELEGVYLKYGDTILASLAEQLTKLKSDDK